MLAYILATLIIFAFAGTVLLHPAFHADLKQAVVRRHGDSVSERSLRDLVSRISVVIPARNEEESLPALLDSIELQTMQPGEVIIVDDQSEDRTASIAAREFTRVIPAGEHPEGWLGKPWAIHNGAEASAGELLLFLDADVRLQKNALEMLGRALVAVSPDWRENSTAISVQPYHRTLRYRERLALLFNILVFVGAAQRVKGLLLSMRGSCCFGPCILCDRRAYESFGGHQAVRRSILDDMDLGEQFRQAGSDIVSFCGRGVVEFRMYPGGVRDLLNGFTKNILLGAQRSGGWFKVLAVLWITGLMAAPLFMALTAASGLIPELVISSVFYIFFAIQFAAAGHRLGRFGPLSALFYPIHLLVFLAVLLRASLLAVSGRNVQWKGRTLHPDDGK
jgi:glycosyltransferase involved in cell wall biosynthesis